MNNMVAAWWIIYALGWQFNCFQLPEKYDGLNEQGNEDVGWEICWVGEKRFWADWVAN